MAKQCQTQSGNVFLFCKIMTHRTQDSSTVCPALPWCLTLQRTHSKQGRWLENQEVCFWKSKNKTHQEINKMPLLMTLSNSQRKWLLQAKQWDKQELAEGLVGSVSPVSTGWLISAVLLKWGVTSWYYWFYRPAAGCTFCKMWSGGKENLRNGERNWQHSKPSHEDASRRSALFSHQHLQWADLLWCQNTQIRVRHGHLQHVAGLNRNTHKLLILHLLELWSDLWPICFCRTSCWRQLWAFRAGRRLCAHRTHCGIYWSFASHKVELNPIFLLLLGQLRRHSSGHIGTRTPHATVSTLTRWAVRCSKLLCLLKGISIAVDYGDKFKVCLCLGHTRQWLQWRAQNVDMWKLSNPAAQTIVTKLNAEWLHT